MLIMKRSGQDRTTFLDTWETYVLVRGEDEIGRIEVHANEGFVTVQGNQFQCRIHPTARQRLAFIPARWVMYTGERELHAARCEGFRTFLVDGPPSLGLLRLRREGLLGMRIGIDRMPDERRIGQGRYLNGRLFSRLRVPQYHLETEQHLPETFELFLAWIVV